MNFESLYDLQRRPAHNDFKVVQIKERYALIHDSLYAVFCIWMPFRKTPHQRHDVWVAIFIRTIFDKRFSSSCIVRYSPLGASVTSSSTGLPVFT